MKIEAGRLRLMNVGQLIEVVSGGTTTMGRLERVKQSQGSEDMALRISGDSVVVKASAIVHIQRSSELAELREVSLAIEDAFELENA